LVVPKGGTVPDVVTAGGTTVAVRCPNHPVARALIEAAGVPVAAPSANRSTELSPTCAEHVLKSLNGRIDFVLDGGPCPGGIESTVVDVTGSVPRVLRPGLISAPQLAEVVGCVEIGASADGVARSPGQMARHYSPRTPLYLVADEDEGIDVLGRLLATKQPVCWLNLGPTRCYLPGALVVSVPNDPEAYSAMLYRELHIAEENGYAIIATLPPEAPEWAGVRDRLLRAAAGA